MTGRSSYTTFRNSSKVKRSNPPATLKLGRLNISGERESMQEGHQRKQGRAKGQKSKKQIRKEEQEAREDKQRWDMTRRETKYDEYLTKR